MFRLRTHSHRRHFLRPSVGILATFFMPYIACTAMSKNSSIAESATLRNDSLMPVAFPGWRRGDKGTALVPTLPSTEIVKLALIGKPSTRYFAEPLGVIRLDAHHAAMIASTIPIDAESGKLDDGCGVGNYCPNYVPIGAYIFTQTSIGWTLTHRGDLVTTVFADDIDKFRVQEWPNHGLVVAFTTSYGYQSQYVTNLTMIALKPDRVIPLLNTSLSTRADFIDAGELDCEDVLDPKYVQAEGVYFNYARCSHTTGQWRFEGDRLRLTFKWATRNDDDHGHLKPLKSWRSTAVLQWTGGDLKLVEGELPEFGI